MGTDTLYRLKKSTPSHTKGDILGIETIRSLYKVIEPDPDWFEKLPTDEEEEKQKEKDSILVGAFTFGTFITILFFLIWQIILLRNEVKVLREEQMIVSPIIL